MISETAEVVVDPEWGYIRLNPIPAEDDLAAFYQSSYYDSLRQGNRAPDLSRMQQGGPEAERERAWICETVHHDIIEWAVTYHGETGCVLEVGSGGGELLDSFAAQGWTAKGLEPAAQAAENCRARGLDVQALTLEQYLTQISPNDVDIDVVVLRLVLEHVRNPIELLQNCHQALRTGGLLIVEVPNDFNGFQKAAQAKLDLDQWWVASPDHVNYFDFDSLSNILERISFDIVDRTTSFPMELFLLMGDNYVGDSDVGSACHERRRSLELNMPHRVRQEFYRALAGAGMGRTCRIAAVAK